MRELGFLLSGNTADCCGCEACINICPRDAIHMMRDVYGFRYPVVERNKCIQCNLCKRVCPISNKPDTNTLMETYGGYINDSMIRERSTSGGLFSALVRSFLDVDNNPRKVYGAVATGLNVKHESALNFDDCKKFCSSKYIQSQIDETYSSIETDLANNYSIMFSGTPCQIAGLRNFLHLKHVNNMEKIVFVEVLCAGVAAPLLFEKYDEYLRQKNGARIRSFYWRYKDRNRWDYNCCHYTLENGKEKTIDRWFSGYWSMFTQRLMMRPSCEKCQYKGKSRIGDITLGDLWGVDREYPELYNDNMGVSLILINTERGNEVFENAKTYITFKQVYFDKMKKYQIPSIQGKRFSPHYEVFMKDLSFLTYPQLCKKWFKAPSLWLVLQKYIFNNAMRVKIWKLKARGLRVLKKVNTESEIERDDNR